MDGRESWWADTWVTQPAVAELESLAVRSNLRGQGVGTKLVRLMDLEPNRLKVHDVIVGALPQNDAAIPRLRRRDFLPYGFVRTASVARNPLSTRVRPNHVGECGQPRR